MHGATAGRIQQRGRVAAMNRGDRVIRVIARHAGEDRTTRIDFNEIEIQRLQNSWLASRGHQRPQLSEAVETRAGFIDKPHRFLSVWFGNDDTVNMHSLPARSDS